MTVSTTVSKSGPYAGAGTTGPFTVGFRFLDNAHLRVVRTDPNGTDTDLVLDTDYSVTGAGDESGEVTLFEALDTGYRLTIVRDVPATQEADYVENDAFPAESHETALDKLTMLVQQLDEESERSIKVGVADTPLQPLPGPSARANTVIGFDAMGNVTVLPLPSSIGAGDRIPFTLTAGVDFVAGVDTQVTLPRAPGADGNLEIFFDPLFQGFDQWDVNDLIVTFVSPIPLGVTKIFGYIGTTLSMQIPPDDSVTDAKVSASAGIQSSKLSFLSTLPGALARTVRDRLSETVSLKDFGAVGDGNSGAADTAAFLSALAAIDDSHTVLDIPPGHYILNSPLAATNKKISILGAGIENTIIEYRGNGNAISLTNHDFFDFVEIGNLTLATNQAEQANGIYIEFGENDATNNRVQVRCYLHDLQLRGMDFAADSFFNGIELNNVHQAYGDNINIIGRGTTSVSVAMSAGLSIYSTGTGAPSDIIFQNTRIYSAMAGVVGRGHLEGVSFSDCRIVAVNVGWDIQLDNPFPLIQILNGHCAAFQACINLNNCPQSILTNNLLYIDPSVATVGLGISLDSCDDTTVANNQVVTPSGLGDPTSYNVSNSQRVRLMNNSAAGYKIAYRIQGTSNFVEVLDNYESSPHAGATIYSDTSSGANNYRRNTPRFRGFGHNVGGGSLGTVATNIITVASDPVVANDIFMVSGMLRATKDGTAGSIQALIVQTAGTAVVQFNDTAPFLRGSDYVAASTEAYISVSGLMRVVSSGTLSLTLQGATSATNASLGASDGQLSMVRL